MSDSDESGKYLASERTITPPKRKKINSWTDNSSSNGPRRKKISSPTSKSLTDFLGVLRTFMVLTAHLLDDDLRCQDGSVNQQLEMYLLYLGTWLKRINEITSRIREAVERIENNTNEDTSTATQNLSTGTYPSNREINEENLWKEMITKLVELDVAVTQTKMHNEDRRYYSPGRLCSLFYQCDDLRKLMLSERNRLAERLEKKIIRTSHN